MTNREKTLIIITGISSSGKTTLAKQLNEKYGLQTYSLDDYKVQCYEKTGFYNEQERLILRQQAIQNFKTDIIKHIRTGSSLVCEYPFTLEWQEFFDYIKEYYKYNIIVVNCNTKPFEDIWNLRIRRDRELIDRHPSLTASAYIKYKTFVPAVTKFTAEYKQLKEQEYITDKYCKLSGDFVISDKLFQTQYLS